MEILEAYNKTLEAARELQRGGIRVKVTPSESTNKDPQNQLPRDKWVIIQLFPKTEQAVASINQVLDELGWAGIVFDTSGHPGQREWAIDWSFEAGPTPDGEWQAARAEVEGMIDKMDGESPPPGECTE